MSSLDTGGNWDSGDDLRVMRVLGVGFGEFTIDCTGKCCNLMENISEEAVLKVKGLLDEYDAALGADSAANLSDTEGKVLVKADVLEWEVTKGGISGPKEEMGRIRNELIKYYEFCTCLTSYLPINEDVTRLYRS